MRVVDGRRGRSVHPDARAIRHDDVKTVDMWRRRPSTTVSCIALAITIACDFPAPTSAQDASPRYWAVTGVSDGKGVNLRAQPSLSGETVGTLPHDARGLANLGCRSEAGLNDASRQQGTQNRWCRVRYKGVEGWVAGRFLKEDPSPPSSASNIAPGPQAAAPKTPADPGPPQAAAPKAPADPPAPVVPPRGPADPGPQAATPKTPVEPGTGAPLSFACTGAEAIVVMVGRDGAVTHERFPPRDAVRLTLSVTPRAPESAGPVTTATIWQFVGPQGERFEGRITWGKAIDAQDGHWQLDLQSRTLHLVRPQEGTAAQFFRFGCE